MLCWFKTDKSAKYVVYSEHQNYPNKGLPFLRDWNWLMEAVEFIKNLDLSEFNYHVGKMTLFRVHKNTIEKMSITSKKEAVFLAISDFAKLYNNKQI
jgi:hypothetical protein